MSGPRWVIAGGGMVAGYAAKQLVELGLERGRLTILSSDSFPPYERPPLSKSFLAGKDTEEQIRINPEPFYREHGIDLRLECEITGLDARQKRLSLASGAPVEFESLILATGSVARTFDLPGAKLEGVQYLRSLGDARAIRGRIANAKRAVVVGGGFIGMETASVLAQKNVETTMVMPDDRIWKHFFSPELSASFEKYFEKHGVRFVKAVHVSEVKGTQSVEGVGLSNGGTLDCDLVIAGIGARPVTEFLQGSGVAVEKGVTVNEYLETDVPRILAAGDIANYPDVLFGKRRRVEHWDNAVQQGQHCARMLMGQRTPFRHVPYFFSDVFDLSYEFWGDTEGAEQVVHRGDLSGTSFSAWWLRGGVVVAAFVMNRPDEEREAAPQWIEGKQHASAAKLADPSLTISAAIEK